MKIIGKRLTSSVALTAAVLLSPLPACSDALLIPPQRPVPKTYFGLHIHRATATRWPEPTFGAWRLHDAYVGWFSLQPSPSQWRFQLLDRYLQLAAADGVELLLPLAFPPRWASAQPDLKGPYQPGSSAPPKTINDWRNYVQQIAQRYRGRIREYELWNEASEPGFFSGTQEELLELAREAYQVLKEVDEENRLLSPSAVGVGGHLRWLEDYLHRGGRYADVINYHFYVPEHPPEIMLSRIHQVRVILKRLGLEDKPLWNTETGWRIENGDGTPEIAGAVDHRWLQLSAAQGAAYVARALVLGWAAGLERFYWYAWDNQNMGLVEPGSGRLKPAGQAFRSVSDWLIGNILQQCSEKQGGLWECTLLRSKGDEAKIVWSTAESRRYCLTPKRGQSIQAHLLSGDSNTLATGCTNVTQQPVMLVQAADSG